MFGNEAVLPGKISAKSYLAEDSCMHNDSREEGEREGEGEGKEWNSLRHREEAGATAGSAFSQYSATTSRKWWQAW